MSDSRIRRARQPAASTHESVLTVTASGVGIEEDQRKVIEVRRFETEPAYVRVSAGVTKRTGDYESLRVDVSVSVPCYVEEIDTVFARTEDLVSGMLDESVGNYLGE